MSHPSKIDILVRAKEAGYTVLLYFVGTDDPQTNIERVALRVVQGGHAVPDDKVRSRWLRTMAFLQQAIRSSDRSYIFDNSVVGTIDTVPRLVFHRIATANGRLPQSELLGTAPAWVKKFVLDPIGINFFDSYGNFRHKTSTGSIVTFPIEAGIRRNEIQSDTIATLAVPPHRSAPHSLESEQRLLGAILADSEVFSRLPMSLEARQDGDKLNVEGGIVGFFSLEMSSEQIATRVISQQSRVPINVIRRGAISEKEFETIRDQAIEFQALPFFIDETTTLSIEQLAARANRLKSQKGLDLLIIDNLELLRTAARTNFGETRHAALQITRELKKLAKELAIPILVLAQLPSKVDRRQDRRPRLEDFNDKGAIEQDADVIILLHRDDFYLSKEEPALGTYEYENWVSRMEKIHGLAELIIAKQRNGATGSVELFFNPGIGSFDDAAT